MPAEKARLLPHGSCLSLEFSMFPQFVAGEIDSVVPGHTVTSSVNLKLTEEQLFPERKEGRSLFNERVHVVLFDGVVQKGDEKASFRQRAYRADPIEHHAPPQTSGGREINSWVSNIFRKAS